MLKNECGNQNYNIYLQSAKKICAHYENVVSLYPKKRGKTFRSSKKTKRIIKSPFFPTQFAIFLPL